MGLSEIEAHREASLRRMLDSPRHSRLGIALEYAAVRALKGRILDRDGEEVPSVFDMAEEIPIPEQYGMGGGNRAMRRSAKAKARRRA